MAASLKTVKHDHRQSMWIIAGGGLLWCYRCGAWRLNNQQGKWHRPTGPNGENPAMARGSKSPNPYRLAE